MVISRLTMECDSSEVSRDAIMSVDYRPLYVTRDSLFVRDREIRSVIDIIYNKKIGKRPVMFYEEVLNDVFIRYRPMFRLCNE